MAFCMFTRGYLLQILLALLCHDNRNLAQFIVLGTSTSLVESNHGPSHVEVNSNCFAYEMIQPGNPL